MTIDSLIHVAESPILVFAFIVLRKVSRVMDALSDFPPHRHVNGKITYPKGFSPVPIETFRQGD